MCGLTGFWELDGGKAPDEIADVCRRMADSLAHRGPDSSGIWQDAEHGLALGHRRLAVIDLSREGHQPMISASGRFVLVYNGEIYNFSELREQLTSQGTRFRGHSDTEVLLEAIAEWGLERTLERINGMFAFALWDRQAKRLTLVRDRLGIKPLYYGWCGSTFLFGSELKAVRRYPGFQPGVDRSSLALFLENGYIPAPASIYQGVRKLPPGHFLSITGVADRDSAEPICYWSLKQIVQGNREAPNRQHANETIHRLEELIRDACRIRLVADVPVATFLSGGIDSSLITAMARAEAGPSLQSFTIGFEEKAYDESSFAREVAEALAVRQTLKTVSPRVAQETIHRLPAIYDEPFADSSQIPTVLISQLARRDVIVCLSGDGGDELFGGYDRYQHIDRIRRKLQWVPQAMRKPLAILYDQVKNRWLSRRSEPGLAVRLAQARSDRELYSLLHRHWPDGKGIVISAEERSPFNADAAWPGLVSFMENMMTYDASTYLPEDILCKVDRASMAFGLEVRVPLLDHRVVEAAFAMPVEQKIALGVGKIPLRTLLSRRLPETLFDRPKTGFGIPLSEWLRGPLREWADDLISEDRLRREGFLHPAPIREKWDEHMDGFRDWGYLLWNVLMFQAWLSEAS